MKNVDNFRLMITLGSFTYNVISRGGGGFQMLTVDYGGGGGGGGGGWGWGFGR